MFLYCFPVSVRATCIWSNQKACSFSSKTTCNFNLKRTKTHCFRKCADYSSAIMIVPKPDPAENATLAEARSCMFFIFACDGVISGVICLFGITGKFVCSLRPSHEEAWWLEEKKAPDDGHKTRCRTVLGCFQKLKRTAMLPNFHGEIWERLVTQKSSQILEPL